MIREWIAKRALKKHALKVCDGVIAIANNDMIVHGTYVTQGIVNEKLAKLGSVCGGRAACLIGSMFIAHGDMPKKPKGTYFGNGVWDGIFGPLRYKWLKERPALKLAYDAFNRAAKNIVDLEHSEWSDNDPSAGPYTDWAEYYFERILGESGDGVEREEEINGELLRHPYQETRIEVIRVAEDAKTLIKTGAVGA